MLYWDSRLRETTTKSGLGPTFTVTSSVELWTSTRELRNFRGCHPCKLKCYIGILGFERRRQSRVLDRTFQLLLQFISEQYIQIYDGIFGFGLKCRVGILGVERRQQSRVLDRTLQLLVRLCFGLRRENLEIFADAIHASINEQLIQIYDGIFGFRLKCRGYSVSRDDNKVGSWTDLYSYEFSCAFDFDERTKKFSWMPFMQTQMQSRDTRFRETTTKSGPGPTFKVTSSVVLLTSTRELRNFRGCLSCNLKYRVGIVGLERQQHSTVLDRTLQLLVQLSFGIRRENLEIFVDAIHASINEQLIQMQSRESRLRETTTNSGLGLTFPVTTSIVLWTSTRELRNFRGRHPCKY
ncbi:LOW QUALITY PROTEIN: hypothetical protein V1477_013510 [Vespula maculifrons]|uniref:Uncharacterized protein n=1 Tax=Vespula maculifrons TaxID=7453 RepID=A0ABD2BQW0_VESMC